MSKRPNPKAQNMCFIIKFLQSFPYTWDELVKKSNFLESFDEFMLHFSGSTNQNETRLSILTHPKSCMEFCKRIAKHESKLREKALRNKAEQVKSQKRSALLAAIATAGIVCCIHTVARSANPFSIDAINLAHCAIALFGACLAEIFGFEFGKQWREMSQFTQKAYGHKYTKRSKLAILEKNDIDKDGIKSQDIDKE